MPPGWESSTIFSAMSTGVINSSGGMGPDSSSYRFDPDHDGSENGHRFLRNVSRKEAYDADITYGTNNEFGFDYLRDNMAFEAAQRVQRRNFAVVDEVDSHSHRRGAHAADHLRSRRGQLGAVPEGERDSAAAQAPGTPSPMPRVNPITARVTTPWTRRPSRCSSATRGHEHVEQMLIDMGLLDPDTSLYDPGNIMLMHHVMAALRAHVLFQKNVDYIVRDGQVIIVDEFTGRTMPGRRWSEGLHQAVEAKEGVPIQQENQTLASITFQNFFRLYDKLAGMTGTADTEAFEFQQIYGLEVVVIPTNQPMQRDDQTDLVYLTAPEKFNAIVEDIRDCVERGQPVLVGTASIEVSEMLSSKLKEAGIEHQVLNAKHHEQEARIVAEAGKPGAGDHCH